MSLEGGGEYEGAELLGIFVFWLLDSARLRGVFNHTKAIHSRRPQD